MASAGLGLEYGQGSTAVKLEPAAVPLLGPHPHLQTSDWHSSDRQKEREEREARRRVLREARKPLGELPVDHMFEIPGRQAAAAARPPARRADRCNARRADRCNAMRASAPVLPGWAVKGGHGVQ